MTRLKGICFFALWLAVWLLPKAAVAQTVTIGTTAPILHESDGSTVGSRPGNLQVKQVTFDDCTKDRYYEFALTTANYTQSFNLQVWAGPVDCGPIAARQATTQQCWNALNGIVERVANPRVNVRVRDILASDKSKGQSYVNASSANVCSGIEKQNLSVYFVLLPNAGGDATSTAKYDFDVDTTGPAAPSSVQVKPGDRLLNVSWTPATGTSDLTGYRVYCVPKPSTTTTRDAETSPSDATTATDASSDDAATTADDSGASSDAASTTTTTATDAGLSTSTGCGGLVEGKSPPGTLAPCAEASGTVASDVNALGLVNGVTYCVAVTGVDAFNNPGVLSDVQEGTPSDVDEFFERYKKAGGKGVGNCSTTGGSSGVLLGGLLLALLGSIARRLRGRKEIA